MLDDHLELFHDSLERTTANPGFLPHFYALFVASSPEVADKLKNTDLGRQSRMLKSSLYLLLLASEGKLEGQLHLERIAKLHGKSELDIRPGLYDLWLDCLVQAVKDFDPKFDPAVEAVWRKMMQPGIEIMKSRYGS